MSMIWDKQKLKIFIFYFISKQKNKINKSCNQLQDPLREHVND